MVDNLIDNAVRHNRPSGLINVICGTDRHTARLVVESGGPLLHHGAVEQLAAPFRRLGAERTGVAERARSRALHRRCGRFCAQRRAQAPRSPAGWTGSGSHPANRCRRAGRDRLGMRVLVVEDAPRFANLIAEGLRDQAIAVDIAYDGREAATMLHVYPYDVVVLEALLRAGPSGLSAEKLLEQAWDENADPFTNTVRVTIGRLRRKLGEPQIIQTTPGIGYRIAASA